MPPRPTAARTRTWRTDRCRCGLADTRTLLFRHASFRTVPGSRCGIRTEAHRRRDRQEAARPAPPRPAPGCLQAAPQGHQRLVGRPATQRAHSRPLHSLAQRIREANGRAGGRVRRPPLLLRRRQAITAGPVEPPRRARMRCRRRPALPDHRSGACFGHHRHSVLRSRSCALSRRSVAPAGHHCGRVRSAAHAQSEACRTARSPDVRRRCDLALRRTVDVHSSASMDRRGRWRVGRDSGGEPGPRHQEPRYGQIHQPVEAVR